MEKTPERMDEVAHYFAEHMSIEELRGEMVATIKEEYLDNDFIFQDDWTNMINALEEGE